MKSCMFIWYYCKGKLTNKLFPEGAYEEYLQFYATLDKTHIVYKSF